MWRDLCILIILIEVRIVAIEDIIILLYCHHRSPSIMHSTSQLVPSLLKERGIHELKFPRIYHIIYDSRQIPSSFNNWWLFGSSGSSPMDKNEELLS
jgi:hypothetical protein